MSFFLSKPLLAKPCRKIRPFFCALLFVTAASLFGQDDPAIENEEWYLNRVIRDIIFDGLRHVKKSELDGITEPYIGQKLTYELYEELNGQIWALDYFEPDIQTRAVPFANDVIIRFIVHEKPVISRIVFEGNKGLRRSELLGIISIKANEVVNQAKIRLDEDALVGKYLEKGFPAITVRSELSKEKDGTETLTFIVSEGEKITVDHVYFEGNEMFSQKTLENQLSLKTKGSIEGFFSGGAFQEAKLLADREAILKFYHDRGYIDSEITDIIRDVTHDVKGNHLRLTFRIHEGEKYTFGGMTFEGNHIFTTEQLDDLVQSKKGEIINQSRLEMDFMRVIGLYTENGYIFNTIDREEHRDNVARTVSYTIPIVERGRAHIESIIVHGNKKTKDNVILREIPVEPGDIFSNTKIGIGLSSLYNMQYFSNVAIDPQQGSEEGLMKLIINVEEQPTTDLQMGLTFSGSNEPDAFPISALFKWTDRNFLGRGNVAGAEINASPDVQSLSLQYTQKWLFGMRLSGGFDLTLMHSKRLAAMDNEAPFFEGTEPYAYPDGFWSFSDYDDAGKLPPDAYLMKYEQWSLSLGFSTGYSFWTPFGNFGVGGSIRTGIKFNDFENDLYRPFDHALRNRNGEWTPANSLAFSVSLDKRDLYYDPSRGYYINERFGIFGLLPNDIEIEHYNRSDTKMEIFFTLWRWQIFEKWAFKGVFGLHTGLSFILPQPGYDAPIIEDANKLSIDGMFIGRGWTGERLNRGFALWENWAELRIPILEHILSLDGFFDAAARRPTPEDMFKNFSSEGTMFIDDMRFSFGAGLRFALPQFPFRFLFAKRFRYYNGDFQWIQGAIGSKPGDPASGVDFVISFAISTY
ncbi:MAG: outer membrane protein assembly factor BamA [Spirochaetaceae bacterium]|jgi:outer membrane protein insertion porin family|nr:outer membrane protein assembly factor BamA [Spirochaetaceae bacterium]